MAETDVTARIDALERQAAHAERALDELNSVVIEQAQTIARLRRLLEQTQDQLASVEQIARTTGTPEAPPPHY